MKSFYGLLMFLMLTSSCVKGNKNGKITIDLEKGVDRILYSDFVDKIEYLTLSTGDSCLMSGIKSIFMDDDTIFVLDSKKAGVFVFNKGGEFIKQINYYGSGPGEFIELRALAIDPLLNHICIYDWASKKINKYNYKGKFIKSDRMNVLANDLAVLEDENILFIIPSYRIDMDYGVWLSDSKGKKIKDLKVDVPKDHKFEFVFTYLNFSNQGIYYYDRNWDDFSYITKDTAVTMYKFDLKQKVDFETRKNDDPGIDALENKSMMANFSNSGDYIALTYFTFGKESPFTWVLFNMENEEVKVSQHLYNDIDGIQSSQNYLFYLNDKVWCRMLDPVENDCNIILQLLSIKNVE